MHEESSENALFRAHRTEKTPELVSGCRRSHLTTKTPALVSVIVRNGSEVDCTDKRMVWDCGLEGRLMPAWADPALFDPPDRRSRTCEITGQLEVKIVPVFRRHDVPALDGLTDVVVGEREHTLAVD